VAKDNRDLLALAAQSGWPQPSIKEADGAETLVHHLDGRDPSALCIVDNTG